MATVLSNDSVTGVVLISAGAGSSAVSDHLTTTRAHVHAPVAIAPTGSAIDTDPTLGDYFSVTVYEDSTLNAPATGTALEGQKILWAVTQPSSGAHTISWGSALNRGADLSAVAFSTTADKTDYVGAVWTGVEWNVIAFTTGY